MPDPVTLRLLRPWEVVALRCVTAGSAVATVAGGILLGVLGRDAPTTLPGLLLVTFGGAALLGALVTLLPWSHRLVIASDRIRVHRLLLPARHVDRDDVAAHVVVDVEQPARFGVVIARRLVLVGGDGRALAFASWSSAGVPWRAALADAGVVVDERRGVLSALDLERELPGSTTLLERRFRHVAIGLAVVGLVVAAAIAVT